MYYTLNEFFSVEDARRLGKGSFPDAETSLAIHRLV